MDNMNDYLKEIEEKIEEDKNLTHEELLLYTLGNLEYENLKSSLLNIIGDFEEHDKKLREITTKWKESNQIYRRKIIENIKKYLTSLDYLERNVYTLFFDELGLEYLYNDQDMITHYKDDFTHYMKHLCKNFHREQYNKLKCKVDNSDCSFCQKFEIEGDSFIKMENNCIIFKKPKYLSSRKKIFKDLNEGFLKFILHLHRKQFFSYDLLVYLFRTSSDSLSRMVGNYFKKCCLEMPDCTYKDVLTKEELIHDIEIIYGSELEVSKWKRKE
jgi:hypothetical protein